MQLLSVNIVLSTAKQLKRNEKPMAKNLILVDTNPDILKYDNRKAIELSQTLGRPLTSSEYEKLKIKKTVKPKKLVLSKR